MDANLAYHEPITFPILTVEGSDGAAGAAGADGVVVLFDNTPSVSVATATTGWETFTGMTSGAITDLANTGDKLWIRTTINPTTDASAYTRAARVQIDGVVVGDASSYYYLFPSGVANLTIDIIATVVSTTSLFLDVTYYSASSTFATTMTHFTEIISVTDITNLSNGVIAQGNSNVSTDL